MTNQEYANTQAAIILHAKAISKLDLHAFMNQIEKAETIAPVVDPTLYRRAMDNMEKVKKLAQAMIEIQVCEIELRTALIATAIRDHEAGIPRAGLNGDINGAGCDPSTP